MPDNTVDSERIKEAVLAVLPQIVKLVNEELNRRGGSGGGNGGGGQRTSIAEQSNKVDQVLKGKPFEAF